MASLTHYHVGDPAELQRPFDVAVVTATILRPSLKRVIRSVFGHSLQGWVQYLIGVDKPLGDRTVLDEALAERPSNVCVTVLDPGYSTSARHGGLHADMWGGALVTILGYMANSRYLAYLGDDNWMGEEHLASLLRAIQGCDWAYSLRWYVDEDSARPLCIDGLESVGPGRGLYGVVFGGWVDPNCMMLDKSRCEDVLRHRSFPFDGPLGTAPSDRGVFNQLRARPSAGTGKATSYYTMQASDVNHAMHMRWIEQELRKAAPGRGPDAGNAV